MQFQIKPDRDVFSLFPTPVACIPIANFDEINPGIERAILTLKGAFGVQNAVRFVNFRPLPPEGS